MGNAELYTRPVPSNKSSKFLFTKLTKSEPHVVFIKLCSRFKNAIRISLKHCHSVGLAVNSLSSTFIWFRFFLRFPVCFSRCLRCWTTAWREQHIINTPIVNYSKILPCVSRRKNVAHKSAITKTYFMRYASTQTTARSWFRFWVYFAFTNFPHLDVILKKTLNSLLFRVQNSLVSPTHDWHWINPWKLDTLLYRQTYQTLAGFHKYRSIINST